MSELNAKAKGFFQSAEYTAAQQLFYKALIICEDFNFVVEAASVHGNLAHVLLKTRQFYEAFKHSDACVKLSPTFDKVPCHKWLHESVNPFCTALTCMLTNSYCLHYVNIHINANIHVPVHVIQHVNQLSESVNPLLCCC